MTTKGGKPGGGDAAVGVGKAREERRRESPEEAFCVVVKTDKRRSNKIYNTELTMTKI